MNAKEGHGLNSDNIFVMSEPSSMSRVPHLADRIMSLKKDIQIVNKHPVTGLRKPIRIRIRLFALHLAPKAKDNRNY